jgi:hypothetical protein
LQSSHTRQGPSDACAVGLKRLNLDLNDLTNGEHVKAPDFAARVRTVDDGDGQRCACSQQNERID